MKKLGLFLIVISSFSFHLKKSKKFVPPGTLQITETFFADKTEISNFSWGEYEYWIKTKYGYMSKEHLAMLPDTLVWRQKLTYNEPYVKFYYRHPAYKDYPVVGISYEQVQAYCKWRTERVREFYSIRYKKELNIEYRLPTKEEWELISNNSINGLNNSGWNEKGNRVLNCAWYADSAKKNHQTTVAPNKFDNDPDVTASVYSYWQNSFGLFNTFGNVAEMTSEPGICKGGSWIHRLEECRAGKDIPYEVPSAWLGFRCVCVVKQAS